MKYCKNCGKEIIEIGRQSEYWIHKRYSNLGSVWCDGLDYHNGKAEYDSLFQRKLKLKMVLK